MGLQTEYRIDSGSSVVGSGTVSLQEGSTLSLGIQPDGLAFRVSGANGNTKALNTSDLVLTDLSIADSGTYVFSTAEGCEVSLEVEVTAFDCTSVGLQTEYRIDSGSSVVGSGTVSLQEGSTLSLGDPA